MDYIHGLLSFENISILCTKLIYKIVGCTDHVINMNKSRELLSVDSFSDINVKDELHEPKEILKKYTWIARKFNHPHMKQYNLFHHAFVINHVDDDIILIEYSGETDYKNKATIKTIKFSEFIGNSLDGQFFIHNINSEHLNDIDTIDKLLENRMGETKYNFINNSCENLCIDILIKQEHKHNYYTQFDYLFDLPGFGLYFLPFLNDLAISFYEKKNEKDKNILKNYIPCQYNVKEGNISVYSNILL